MYGTIFFANFLVSYALKCLHRKCGNGEIFTSTYCKNLKNCKIVVPINDSKERNEQFIKYDLSIGKKVMAPCAYSVRLNFYCFVAIFSFSGPFRFCG